ncbi:unnamed protein product [Dicrocoelium dendriticum]|nr:unnamed protein product [Dicrocoelium dendriticum]
MVKCDATFISSAVSSDHITQLNSWLVDQAIHVPTGWIEACVSWLVDEHGGLHACAALTKPDWCQLIYEQWLHADLHQLSCPVLPTSDGAGHDTSTGSGSTVMKLDGELCLQVVGLFNIGESYYSQLRRSEGNLSADLPLLDHPDTDGDGDRDYTRMTQAYSQYGNSSTASQNRFNRSSTPPCHSLFLTDGITQIKAVELGTLVRGNRSLLSHDELLRRLRPGVKVRLRGPLVLRKNVLLLPPGAIETLNHPQLQVDELLQGASGNLMYQLGLLLARKLNIPVSEGTQLPSWFPKLSTEHTSAPVSSEPSAAIPSAQSGQQPLLPPTEQPSLLPPSSHTSPEPWDHDSDALLKEVADNFEQQAVRSFAVATPMIHALAGMVPNRPVAEVAPVGQVKHSDSFDDLYNLSAEVDPDVLASAFDDLANEDMMSRAQAARNDTHSCFVSASSFVAKRDNVVVATSTAPSKPCGNHPKVGGLRQALLTATSLTAPLSPPPTEKSVLSAAESVAETLSGAPSLPAPPSAAASAKHALPADSDDLLPPLVKRKPWVNKTNINDGTIVGFSATSSSISSTSGTATSTVDYRFHPFCYIEDMYNELIKDTSNSFIPRRRVYTIRGLLVSLLSSLEHHQGTRWTLAARLADGSATVDVDISSELLTEWIGLTASESESLRQMSRAAMGGSNPNALAVQEAQRHRHRLRSALNSFQYRLSNLSGLFDIRPPPATSLSVQESVDPEKPIRPILVDHRPMNGEWLQQLRERVLWRKATMT